MYVLDMQDICSTPLNSLPVKVWGSHLCNDIRFTLLVESSR